MSESDFIKYPTGKIEINKFCSACGRYNSRYSTTEVVIICKNEILLLKRSIDPQKDWWSLPGGYVNWNETLEEAAKREVKEETGINCNLDFFKIFSDPSRDPDGRQNIAHVYISKLERKPELVVDESENSEAKWFSLDKLPKNIAFDHLEMIQAVAKYLIDKD